MIKINLATQKQAGFTAGGKASPFSKLGFENLEPILEKLRGLPIKRLLAALAAAIVATIGLNTYESQLLKETDEEMKFLESERDKYQAELSKKTGYEKIKQQLETDEFTIRTKIETIEKLVSDRGQAAELLLQLSEIVPERLWLTDFSIGDEIKLVGKAADFNQISDFMKKLGESAYFSDVKLLTSSENREQSGLSIVGFNLSAKKK